MLAIKNKYKASTLMEVIVAMVIILICAGLGMSAFTNLQKDMNGNLEIQAKVYMDKLANDSKAEGKYIDKVFEIEGIRIERSFKPYRKEKRMLLMQVEAFNNLNKKIGEIKELILVPHD